ncbi:MAG: peptidoglycan bridge formation glycyltransferase FemA/FemB family protein [Candidatus Methanoperedens sp.]|nr:peptidoglycan bridge formation glycyltransferase FemA/FemB family protein [Candidatus Methanoperedens sp.]
MPENLFKIIEPNEVDLNAFVEKSEYPSIFQTTHMVEVYKSIDGYEPVTLAVINENNEILSSLVAVKFIENKFIKSLSKHSTVRGGPIFSQKDDGIKATELLLNEYNNNAKRDALYSRIYPLFNVDKFQNIAILCGYNREDWLNFIIDLQQSKEDLWNNLSKHRKKGINRAEKSGIIVEEMKNPNDLPLFYELLRSTHNKAKVPLPDFNFFKSVYQILGKKKYARFYFVRYNNKAIAARLILTYCSNIYDWYAGADSNFNDKYPSEYLIWNILIMGHNEGYKTFDFGGAGIPSEEYGVREFKRKFGGEQVNYGRYTNIHHNFNFKLAMNTYNLINRLRLL